MQGLRKEVREAKDKKRKICSSEWDWLVKNHSGQVRVDLKEKDGEALVSQVKKRTEFKIS